MKTEQIPKAVHDNLDDMIAWEQGELANWDEIKLFQRLINNGMAWKLQGCYGRHATELLEQGICHAADPTDPNGENDE